MSDIIEKMALVQVPEDFLHRIDVDAVVARMHGNFCKLDSLKKFRNEHDQRNAFMRWWDNDKLEGAQLDAQELQAEFSKSLSQLMMIVLLHSQRIASQQRQIGVQQTALAGQAEELAEQTQALVAQQVALKEQSEALETLVVDYVALRGLTEDGARKLMRVATEVKSAREGLQQRFDTALAQVEASMADMGVRHLALEHAQVRLDEIQVEIGAGIDEGRLALRKLQQQIRVMKWALGGLAMVVGLMGWQIFF
ncbi:hypothetical protein [Xanthomonas sp. CFBP 7698]|uniref:hypothetical protein n=1 Tax=Xanthomonas sp. CFBP 7698 TaxID=2082399 RepID=UPI000ED1917C|nr:hypothetical protein [Xanthomonas sp. CFBP 7698]RJS02675.1 hypothetical protein XnspCFBP7698_13820 [Xanthomonas sp. CFBP 7698]